MMQYIAKSAQEGDQMMRIESGNGVIVPSLAAQNSLSPEKEVNVGMMPGALKVKIHYQPSEISLSVVSNREPEINITRTRTTD
ncbi:hypothetical protein KHA80_12995 [Anaerobacillus sp. HL2]|nr:hypothetical protein KHA80_12995 [Anaerobacillus sp. HL2]